MTPELAASVRQKLGFGTDVADDQLDNKTAEMALLSPQTSNASPANWTSKAGKYWRCRRRTRSSTQSPSRCTARTSTPSGNWRSVLASPNRLQSSSTP